MEKIKNIDLGPRQTKKLSDLAKDIRAEQNVYRTEWGYGTVLSFDGLVRRPEVGEELKRILLDYGWEVSKKTLKPLTEALTRLLEKARAERPSQKEWEERPAVPDLMKIDADPNAQRPAQARRNKLLTREIEERFAEVGTQSEVRDPIVICKLFNPCGAGTWWLTEYEPEDRILWGYVDLVPGCDEFGSVSLDELESLRVPPFGLGLERDLHWTEKPLSKALAEAGLEGRWLA